MKKKFIKKIYKYCDYEATLVVDDTLSKRKYSQKINLEVKI